MNEINQQILIKRLLNSTLLISKFKFEISQKLIEEKFSLTKNKKKILLLNRGINRVNLIRIIVTDILIELL